MPTKKLSAIEQLCADIQRLKVEHTQAVKVVEAINEKLLAKIEELDIHLGLKQVDIKEPTS